jgi:hypothetical protein
VAVEDYEHQHQDLRTEDGVTYGDTADEMDFPYLAKVTQFNIRALDKLARTPAPPASAAQAAVQTFTDVSWSEVPGAIGYTAWQRRTDEPYWREEPVIENVVATSARLDGVRGDDWIFGVSATGKDGSMSPVSSAVPAGEFAPIPGEEDDSE